MPTPRKGETTEEMNARRRDWRAIRRTEGPAGTSTVYVPPRETFKQLDSANLIRRSTLVDAEGNVIQTWHIESPEGKARLEAVKEAIEELKNDLPRAPVLPSPTSTDDDFLAGYPVGDHHMGLLAWKYEVGASYDLDIGEQLLANAGVHLIGTMFPATHAIVAFLGDFVHYDSMVPETPHGRNPLDADGRAAKMVRAAMRTMRRLIEQAAARHKYVHVIIEFGNHDPFSSLWLMEAMRIKYEDNPRITIDCNPGSYHYHQFGSNLIATHHGDQTKMANLPGILAASVPEMWGATTNRVVWTGHIHSLTAQDYPGCTVESFRILPPADAWAHKKGYRSARDMKAILFHKEYGEVARYAFNPSMLEGKA